MIGNLLWFGSGILTAIVMIGYVGYFSTLPEVKTTERHAHELARAWQRGYQDGHIHGYTHGKHPIPELCKGATDDHD